MSRDLRTPETRDFILSRAQAGIEADYDRRIADTSAIREAIRADSGVDVSEEEIRDLGRVYRPVVTKGFWLEFLQRHCVQALPRLLAKGWTLMHADTDCEFITSDIGLLKHRGAWDRPVQYAPGWWNNADGWLLPLTPKLILMMAPCLNDQEKLAQRVYVDQVNRSIAKQAKEFVFAASESELRRAVDAS
jgi:hypothetical protein